MAVPPKLLSLERFTVGARELIVRAQQLADARHHAWLTPFHVLACVLDVRAVTTIMRAAGADPQKTREATDAELLRLPLAKPQELSGMDKAAVDMVERAERRAVGAKVTIGDVVIALLRTGSAMPAIDAGKLTKAISAFEHVRPTAG